jgi:Xaa-Pro aminopeptidase
MFEKRLKSVQECLRANKCSYLLITEPADVEYISGFRSSNAAVLFSLREKILFSDFRYKSSAELFLRRNPEWKFVLAKESLYSSITENLKSGEVVGFQSDLLSVDTFTRLKKTAKKVAFVPLSGIISGLFVSKSAIEIQCMRKAAAIADKSFQDLLAVIKPEMTEIEAARQLELFCLQNGSEGPSFDTIVLSGPHSALPHGKPGNRKLGSGKFVLVDFGCRFRGFCSDMTRTFAIGSASSRMKKIYTTVLDAQLLACTSAHAGLFSDQLDKVARDVIASAGFGEHFGHALGHGVGLKIHEQPRVSPHTHVLLEAGSVVTIEPGIYIPGFGGVRIEDMVVLSDKKADIITSTPKELLIL